jgi:ATP-dependent helicase/nuclease subunit A
VVERPDRETPGRDNVQPGLHVLGTSSDSERPPAAYPVVWWDPRALTLGARPAVGIPHQDLIEDPGPEVVEADRRRYADWQRARQVALEQGARASFVVETVTERAQRAGDDQAPEPEVTVVDAASGVARPSGPRFGTLVHAVLATVALDADRDAIADVATMQARILAATSDETAAATALAQAALSHPLLLRAREAWRTDRCRRETPITAVEPDGSILEGVLDLAFEDDDGWTVVDFKTQAELAGPLARYRRQVRAYASVVARVTGRPVTAVLMRL